MQVYRIATIIIFNAEKNTDELFQRVVMQSAERCRTIITFATQGVLYYDTNTKYSETCLRWSLCKAATSLKQPASLVPDSTKALESTSVEQPPLYNGQLELAHGGCLRQVSLYYYSNAVRTKFQNITHVCH